MNWFTPCNSNFYKKLCKKNKVSQHNSICNKMENILLIINLIAIIFFAFAKMKFELQMMQQNSYRNERYIKWFKNNFTKGNRIPELVLFLMLAGSFFINIYVVFGVGIVGYSILAYLLLTKKHKLKLVFTQRAKRLFFSSSIILLLINLVSILLITNFLYQILVISATIIISFLIVLVTNFLLKPVEAKINRWYYNDAKKILRSMPDLKIIGITGSYGKTSTKHFLHRILSEKYNVLMTPGSYNTTMGVIRTVREYLKPTHQVFIVEMGAKQEGDIAEICELVKPKIGILTSVAEQHLDTFKIIENVRKTKFELIDSLPQNGLAVLNADYDIIKKRNVTNTKVKYYSSEKSKSEYFINNIEYTKNGSAFTVSENNSELQLDTKLVGSYNLSNILASCVVAKYLEVPDNKISFAVKKLEAVKHRLEVKKNQSGITIIDDAFNSNPKGAKMALEVLNNIAGTRKIIITPGMIELADKHEFYNQKFGEQIADVCDLVILVGKKITKPILKGLKNKNYSEQNIYIAENLSDAIKHINLTVKSGDVLLYENDLPDTYEQ